MIIHAYMQNLQLGLRPGPKPGIAAIAMLLMSQAPTLQALSMRHDAMPSSNLGSLASLQSLTFFGVRCYDSGPTVRSRSAAHPRSTSVES